MAKRKPYPAKYFVATYGDTGLEVTFFSNKRKYEKALREAEQLHEVASLGSYTNGDVYV